MSGSLLQCVLAQRGDDEGWTNLLFFVVVAVIYVVGAAVKAMKEKSGDEQQPRRASRSQTPQRGRVAHQVSRRPQRPAGAATRSTQPPRRPQKRTTFADLREAARRFAAEAERAFQPQETESTTKTASQPASPPARPPASPVRPEIKPIIEPVVPQIKGLSAKDKQLANMRAASAQQLSDLLADYSDPQTLRKAILHYEILGPPLSLRN
jgi:hypothetical protein